MLYYVITIARFYKFYVIPCLDFTIDRASSLEKKNTVSTEYDLRLPQPSFVGTLLLI